MNATSAAPITGSNPRLIVTDKMTQTTGAVVWWSCSSAPYSAIEAVFKSLGQQAPLPTTPGEALRRAAAGMGGGGYFCRPVANSSRETLRIIAEEVKSYRVVCEIFAEYDQAGAFKGFGGATEQNHLPGEEQLADHMAQQAAQFSSHLAASDIGSHLSKLIAARFSGISLRRQGGFYFVPAFHLAAWRQLTTALSACGQTFSEIPAMPGEEAAAALLGALREEMQAEAAEVEAAMAEEPGKRALATLESRVKSAKAKLEAYQALLGQALPDAAEALTSLGASVAMAIIAKKEGGAP